MSRLFASLCLVGVAALSASCVSAQSPVGTASKSVRVAPTQGEAAPRVDGEVPAEAVEKLRAELAAQQSVAAADVKVISAEALNWPNGGLGCAKPGSMYTQAIVPGYRVVLEASGKRFAYHASKKGEFRLCTRSSPSVPAAADR